MAFNMHDSQTAAGFFDETISSPTVDKKRDAPKRDQSIGSVTIKQVLSTFGDTFSIGRIEITLVKVLARVKQITISNVKTVYELEDETGSMEGVQWRDGDNPDDQAETSPVVENSLCMVVGSIREVEGRKTLLVLNICAVDNPNVVTEHLLSIVHMKLSAAVMEANAQKSEVAVTNGDHTNGSDLTIHQKIFSFITRVGAGNEAGVNRVAVIAEFGSRHSTKEIDESLAHLCDEGQLYTTVDDTHYKSTE